MKFKGRFSLPTLNLSAYRRALHQQLSEATAEAAYAWLSAATPGIPTWSGASRGTFLPLAREAGFRLSIDPVVQTDINTGESASTGTIEADSTTGLYRFTYTTLLEHLIYNEYNNANRNPDRTLFFRLRNPGPYRFQDKGRAAYFKVARSTRLPNPFGFIRVKRRTVG